jgi:hypothetical protein
MKNLFVYINRDEKTIHNIVQELPNNWKNIHGMCLIDEEKLEDLSWAGHENQGWVNIKKFDLSDYSYIGDWLEISKNCMKKMVSDERKIKVKELLTWNNYMILADEKTKSSLYFKSLVAEKNLSQKYSWKFEGSYGEIDYYDIIDIIKFIDSYQQTCFDLEKNKLEEIDNAKNVSEICQLDINVTWPSTSYAN